MLNNDLYEYFSSEPVSNTPIDNDNEADDLNYSKWMKLVEKKNPLKNLVETVKSKQYDGTEIYLRCQLDNDYANKTKGKCDNEDCIFDRCIISNLLNEKKVKLCNNDDLEYESKCINRIISNFHKTNNNSYYKNLHKEFSKDVLDRSDSWKDSCFNNKDTLYQCLKSNFDSIKNISKINNKGIKEIFSDMATKRISKILNNKKKCDKSECPVKKCTNDCIKIKEDLNNIDNKYKNLIKQHRIKTKQNKIRINDVKSQLKNDLDVCHFKRIDAMKKIGITKELYETELKAAKKKNIVWIWILGIIVIALAITLLVNGKILLKPALFNRVDI
jgi:hypothetical protein